MLGHVLSVVLPDENCNIGVGNNNGNNGHNGSPEFGGSLSELNLRKLTSSSLTSVATSSPGVSFRSMLKLSKLKEAIISDLNATGGGASNNKSGHLHPLQAASGHAQSHSTPNLLNSLVLHVFNDVNIYRALLPVVSHVQLLWELVLTCEPIAIIAQSPNVCSDVVFALVNAISPLKYGADYRPFFTIHDSEFKEYTSHAASP